MIGLQPDFLENGGILIGEVDDSLDVVFGAVDHPELLHLLIELDLIEIIP